MKLLVLAQIPPPVHGQSIMVRTLVEGLPGHGIEVHHVDLRLSRDQADIGRWRPGKVAALLDACAQAVLLRFTRGCDTLYYVPAPGKRGALWRDMLAMLLVRPFFRRVVFHWAAAGLAGWLRTRASLPERAAARLLLGRADLSMVLAGTLRDDAEYLRSARIEVVPNGITDPCPGFPGRASRQPGRFEVLFLGLCSEEKGLFDAAEAVLAASRRDPATRFRLTAAGEFPDAPTSARFARLAGAHPGEIRHAGFVSGVRKRDLFLQSDCLCLPTRYPHEGQPLVLIEALAFDLPIVATRWRGIPGMLPDASCRLVPPGDIAGLAHALLATSASPPPGGAGRAHFLRCFTVQAHLGAFSASIARVG